MFVYLMPLKMHPPGVPFTAISRDCIYTPVKIDAEFRILEPLGSSLMLAKGFPTGFIFFGSRAGCTGWQKQYKYAGHKNGECLKKGNLMIFHYMNRLVLFELNPLIYLIPSEKKIYPL
jgi:hypothetical protein